MHFKISDPHGRGRGKNHPKGLEGIMSHACTGLGTGPIPISRWQNLITNDQSTQKVLASVLGINQTQTKHYFCSAKQILKARPNGRKLLLNTLAALLKKLQKNLQDQKISNTQKCKIYNIWYSTKNYQVCKKPRIYDIRKSKTSHLQLTKN